MEFRSASRHAALVSAPGPRAPIRKATACSTLERAYPATPARVFAALADPAAKARWCAGPEAEHEMDFRIGGRETVHREGHDGDPALTFESVYQDIVPDERIVYTSVLFDAVGPVRHVGAKAHAERVAEWLSAYRGGIDYQIRDLCITAGADVAFCHYLYRVGGTMTDGTQVGMWLRSTICLRKTDRDWIIAHEHTSVPFDGATGAASLDLQPD